ncbi:hypothetical protein GH891_30855 [Bacillus thuringiensis]|nr:hypothetical protein [Bacillus thuringiensis]
MFGFFRRRKNKQENKVTLQQAFDRICEELDGDPQAGSYFMINRQTNTTAYRRWQLAAPSDRVLVTQARVRNLDENLTSKQANMKKGI